MYILLVTWLVANQPATSYQVQFSDQATCEGARSALMAEAAKLPLELAEHEAHVGDVMHMTLSPGRAPEVVVVCAKQ
jgi:hypothetical protein